MTIYLDYIFLENLVINVVIIIQINIFLKLKLNKYRIIICSILDSIFSVINYLYLDNFIFSLIFSYISFYILFHNLFKIKTKIIKTIMFYYIVYISYIGLIIFVECIININLDSFLNKILIYLVCAFLNSLMLSNLWKVWKTKIKEYNLSVVIEIDNIQIDAFVDTGNLVKDNYLNLNVIFLDKKLKRNILKYYLDNNFNIELITFNVSTVNGLETYEGYVVKNIKIRNSKNEEAIIPKIIFCFNLDGIIIDNTPKKYSAIISYETYLDNFIGGV